MKTNLRPTPARHGRTTSSTLGAWCASMVAAILLPAALAQTPSVTPDHGAYYPGEPIAVRFAQGPGNALDWVGIYPDGVVPGESPSTAWLYVGGTQQAGAGLTDGTVTFANGLNLAGDWKAYLLLNDGYSILAEASFKVVDPYAPLIRLDKAAYGPGEPITITFTNGWANPKDWIGVYVAGETPGGGPNATLWSYVDGTQAGVEGKADGSITFPTGLNKEGAYVAHLLLNDGYDIVASEPFTVSAAAGLPKVVVVSPAPNEVDVAPLPRYRATLSHGSTQIVPGTIALTFDGAAVTPQVTADGANLVVTYESNTLLAAGSAHMFVLAFADNATPPNAFTNEVSFTVVRYLSLELPAPLFFESFNTTPEGQLPAGWTETNFTDVLTPDLDPTDLNSAFYAGWVTVDVDRFKGEFTTYSDPDAPLGDREDYHRVLTENPRYVVNGKLVSPLADGRMLFANSGYRTGRSQVQFLYSPVYNLTSKTDIHLSFHSLWEQNQDSVAALEFTVDAGQNWLPIAYLINGPDIIRNAENEIDAEATLTTTADDIAVYYDPNDGLDKGGFYGAFIAAPISPALAPFIQARVDDNKQESKRVELFRLPQADGQAKVQFRFAHAGTDSWYWGMDDFGLYSIPQIAPPTLTTQPQSQTVFAGDAVTFTVAADGIGPFTYQWLLNGNPLEEATAATLVISHAQAANAGTYSARVTNSGGNTDSNSATLAVQPLPDVVSGIWNFGSEQLERTSGVGSLEYADGEATSSLTSFEEGPPQMAGANPAFMRVPAFTDQASGYSLTMPTQPVGSEGYLNRYSMAWDVFLPWDLSWMPFFNSAPDNGNDADFYVSDLGALGIGTLGYSAAGAVEPETWYRVVFTANLTSGRVTIYVNGTAVHRRSGGSLADGRFALYTGADAGPDLRLFNEGDTSGDYTHEVLVNSFAFISRELTPAEVAAMGGPTVAGITLPAPVTPITVGPATVADGTITFSWTGGSSPFQVQKTASLAAPAWENLGQPTSLRTATDSAAGSAAFYRVVGQ